MDKYILYAVVSASPKISGQSKTFKRKNAISQSFVAGRKSLSLNMLKHALFYQLSPKINKTDNIPRLCQNFWGKWSSTQNIKCLRKNLIQPSGKERSCCFRFNRCAYYYFFVLGLFWVDLGDCVLFWVDLVDLWEHLDLLENDWCRWWGDRGSKFVLMCWDICARKKPGSKNRGFGGLCIVTHTFNACTFSGKCTRVLSTS